MDFNESVKVSNKSSILMLVLGWILAFAALIKFPLIFGVLGIVLGILATKNGSRGGLPLIMASMLLMAAGLIFNNIIFNYLRHFMGF